MSFPVFTFSAVFSATDPHSTVSAEGTVIGTIHPWEDGTFTARNSEGFMIDRGNGHARIFTSRQTAARAIWKQR